MVVLKHEFFSINISVNFRLTHIKQSDISPYVVVSKSFRPDLQKPRQMENAVRDI